MGCDAKISSRDHSHKMAKVLAHGSSRLYCGDDLAELVDHKNVITHELPVRYAFPRCGETCLSRTLDVKFRMITDEHRFVRRHVTAAKCAMKDFALGLP